MNDFDKFLYKCMDMYVIYMPICLLTIIVGLFLKPINMLGGLLNGFCIIAAISMAMSLLMEISINLKLKDALSFNEILFLSLIDISFIMLITPMSVSELGIYIIMHFPSIESITLFLVSYLLGYMLLSQLYKFLKKYIQTKVIKLLFILIILLLSIANMIK